LCRAYGIAATNPNGPGYESVLSMLTRAVMGHGAFYYITIASVLLVLALSANTAFADFPRLTRVIALDDYLPHVFLLRGRRLLDSWGNYVLVALTALLLIIFGGVTDRLIPLFAVGAFMAFTLSQAGMVMHWKRQGNAPFRMAVNGLGAVATGITAVVVLVAKFAQSIATTLAWTATLLSTGPSFRLRSANPSWCCPSTAGAGLPRRRSPLRSACPAIFAACTCRPATSRTRSPWHGRLR
jgi:amino acid transporter